ncbi:hypothetical protein, partial [Xanthomonas citri]|uniref:hypothetical protein n=1 Tax=Xanthomonas citri TaxID=346 RepID=UPI001A8E6E60
PLHKAIVSRICGELIRPSLSGGEFAAVKSSESSCHDKGEKALMEHIEPTVAMQPKFGEACGP